MLTYTAVKADEATAHTFATRALADAMLQEWTCEYGPADAAAFALSDDRMAGWIVRGAVTPETVKAAHTVRVALWEAGQRF